MKWRVSAFVPLAAVAVALLAATVAGSGTPDSGLSQGSASAASDTADSTHEGPRIVRGWRPPSDWWQVKAPDVDGVLEDNLAYAGLIAILIFSMFGVYLVYVRYRQHQCNRRRWLRLIVGNLLALLSAGSLAAVCGETYFRFWYDTTDSFILAKTSDRWFKRHWNVNNAYARDNRDYFVPRRGGARVTFIGDSVTAGQGIGNIEDRFGNRIRRAHPEWEVHVAGYSGYDAGQELEVMQAMTEGGYDFDLVVLVYCVNDIDDVIPQWRDKLDEMKELGKRLKLNWLVEHSYLLNTLYNRMWMFTFPRACNYHQLELDAYSGSPWQSHAPRLKAMRDLVRAGGGQFCIVTFPIMNLVGPNYEFRQVHKQLDDYWRSIGVPNLDLLPVFEKYPAGKLVVNAYDAHPNEFANELAADAILKFRSHVVNGVPQSKPLTLPQLRLH